MRIKLLFTSLCILFVSCSATREYLMPFYNFGYTGGRLQPVQLNNTDFTFRVWINHGTSVERVISVSRDKSFGDEAYLDEINVASKNNKPEKFYRKTRISLKSGIAGFIAKVDSLGLLSYQSQTDSTFNTGLHQPFSLYIVEIKKGSRYTCFKFKTAYPIQKKDSSKYQGIEDFIFSEVKYPFYFK